jgi:hypothetical protein
MAVGFFGMFLSLYTYRKKLGVPRVTKVTKVRPLTVLCPFP